MPLVERVIRSLQRGCLDRVIVLDQRHRRRLLRDYLGYYHGCRTHPGLAKEAPVSREVEPPESMAIPAAPMVCGLHHRHFRQAA